MNPITFHRLAFLVLTAVGVLCVVVAVGFHMDSRTAIQQLDAEGRSHQLSVIDTAHVTSIPALCLTAAAAFVSASICLKAER